MTYEQTLLDRMTTAAGMAEVVASGLRVEVFEKPIHQDVFCWMLDYWERTGRTQTPTPAILAEKFPRVPIENGDGAVGYLIDELRTRYLGNQMSAVLVSSAERLAKPDGREHPETVAAKFISDVQAVLDEAGSPEPLRYDPALVTERLIRLHSDAEARRRFDEETLGAQVSSWEPVELGPYLRGEIEMPRPTMGVARSDGLRLLYPGLDHSVISETGAGKTWFANACVLAEIEAGNPVVYVHYEEADPASTIERLLLLGVDADDAEKLLTFVGPCTPVRDEHLQRLLDLAPTLVVHDGMNEGMVMIGGPTKDVEGAALFRQRLVVPFLRINAATLTCDHFPMGADPSRVEAYGSVHKGNAMAGPRFSLENKETFGRGLKGRSSLYVTKDRNGHLFRHATATKIVNKRFLGSMVIDAKGFMGKPRFEFSLSAPSQQETDCEDGPGGGPSIFLANAIYHIVVSQPDHTIESQRMLFARLRVTTAGGFTNSEARAALDDLVYSQPPRLIEVPGKNRAKGYRAVVGAS